MELTIEQALQQGVSAHKEGKFEVAERLYRAILQSQPAHPDANHNLGALAVSVNKADVALPLFRTALEANTKVEQYWFSYIDALIREKQFDKAKELIEQAKKQGIDGTKLHSLKTQLVPIPQTENANSGSPSQTQLSSLLEHYQNGRFSDAEKLAISITQEFPAHQFGWKVLGAILKQTGRISESLAASQKSSQLMPQDAEAHNNLAITLQELGRLEEAEASYTQAIAVKPDFAEAYSNLGNTLKGLGRLEEAEASLRQAIALKPELTKAYSNLGVTLKELGRLEEAMQVYNNVIRIKPDYAEAHCNLGVTLSKLGRLEEAEASYRQSILLKPDYAEAHNNLGVALKEMGRSDESEVSYRQSIALKPNYAGAHNNLGVTLKELGRLEEAEASYRQSIALKPNYASAYNNLGGTLTELGKLEEAIQVYNEAISIKPDYPSPWNNIFFALQAIKMELSSREELVSYYPESANSKYAKIAKSILNYQLSKGRGNVVSSVGDALSVLANAENITIKNPASHKTSAGLDPVLPKKVIALVHFGRSGTGLLHSLIDGHPEVSTLPSVYFSEYFDHSTWRKIISGGWSEMIKRFMAIYEVLFNASSTVPVQSKSKNLLYNIGQNDGMTDVGDQRDEVLSVDKTLFCSELNRLMNYYDELDAFVFFTLVHAAYDKAINDLNQKTLNFYHIHNPSEYSQLNFFRSAPNANWIMMVREPVQSCESWSRKHFEENNYNKIANTIFSMLFEIDNSFYHKKTSIGVRLEDLKEYPRKTIPALCRWMGIKETEGLYEMTAQGKKWWGDPSSPDYLADGMNPFGNTSIKRKVGSIFSKNDQFILRTLYYPFSVHFGYVEENAEQFKIDLQSIRLMLDAMFDFEKIIAERTQVDPEKFITSGSYLFLRSGLIERWNTLNKFHTYPNMIKPLRI